MDSKSSNPLSFQSLVDYVSQSNIRGNFRPDILKNRLELIGVKDLVENRTIARRGFPFKYYAPLDEAILIFHYFLAKSNAIPDSHIRVNSIHIPNKEEENTLSFWKSPKAGLYLDLHNLIENNNTARRGEKSTSTRLQKRIFVFRDNAHLAFLEATGIGVVLEQQSIGIETTFILQSLQSDERRSAIKGGTILIQLLHEEDEKCEWALAIDPIDNTSLPYESQLLCSWHAGRFCADGMKDQFIREWKFDIDEYVRLFDPEYRNVMDRTGVDTYEFPNSPSDFEILLKENFRKSFGDLAEEQSHYNQQLEVRSIPTTLKQFHEALSRTQESKNITAIDASSVKSTLRIHEADPNYRHWIRQTVELAIRDSNVSLNRIYIIDRKKTGDYAFFQQEMALYRDFLNNNIPALDEIWEIPGVETIAIDRAAFNHENIRIYITSKDRIKRFCNELSVDNRALIFDLLADDFFPRPKQRPNNGLILEKLRVFMPRLDFLYSEKLIFNYKDYRGEPGQALYDANLFAPGNPSESRSNEVQFLPHNEFAAKGEKYSQLFEIIRGLSIRVRVEEVNTEIPSLQVTNTRLRQVSLTNDQLSRILAPQVLNDMSGKVKLFVSYVEEDDKKVSLIVNRLKQEGYDVWNYRESTFIGEDFPAGQSKAINNCDFFLSCYSSNSRAKRGYFRAELNGALERKKTFLPDDIFILLVTLDDVEVEVQLREYLKFGRLFQHDRLDDSCWEKLLMSIQEGLRRRGA